MLVITFLFSLSLKKTCVYNAILNSFDSHKTLTENKFNEKFLKKKKGRDVALEFFFPKQLKLES